MRGEFAVALAAFEAALAAGGDDAAIHYNIGVCAYKLGDYIRAEAAFQTLARRFPAMRELGEYNLGLSLMRQQRLDEAREAFEAARLGGDEKIAAFAATALARLGPNEPSSDAGASTSPTSAWLKLVDVGIGHDGNVALVDESTLPLGDTSESAFAEAFGYLSGSVGPQRQWRFDLSAYLVTYADVAGFDQAAVRVAGMREWRLPRWRVEAGPHYARTTLDGSDLEAHWGGSVDARYALAARQSFGLRVVHDELEDLDAQYGYLAGERDRLRVTYERGMLRLGYERERNDRAGAGVSADRDRYMLRIGLPLPGRWAADLDYEARASDYDSLAVPRSEDRRELAFSLRRDFGRAWEFETQILYAENDSSDPLYAYTRRRIAAGIGKVF